jgi:hypothetical protein
VCFIFYLCIPLLFSFLFYIFYVTSVHLSYFCVLYFLSVFLIIISFLCMRALLFLLLEYMSVLFHFCA